MPVVRELTPNDLPAVLAINNAHAAELSLLDAAQLERLVTVAAARLALGPERAPDAFLMAFDERTPPQGANHSWFLARHRRFLYVDRVCVAAHAQKRGLARALYEALMEHGQAVGVPLLCCEVNTEPPNPASDAFHRAMGFTPVGEAFLADRGKAVRYFERRL